MFLLILLMPLKLSVRNYLNKSMKIAEKFKEELKLANLEKQELIVRLDESNKKNEFLRNQYSSQLHVVYCVKVQLYILLKKLY